MRCDSPEVAKSQDGKPSQSNGLGRSLRNLMRWTGIAVLVQVLCIGFSNWHPILELANHFAMHGLALSFFIAPCLFRIGSRRLGSLLVFAMIYLAILIQPWTLLPRGGSGSDSDIGVQVLCWNLLAKNASYGAMLELIDQVDPDVLVLIEVAPSLFESVPEIVQRYPHSVAFPAPRGSGIAVLSRMPGTEFERQDFQCPFQPAIVTRFPIGDSGGELQVVALHPLSPIPVGRTKIRDEQLAAFLSWAEQSQGAICVCGDFNTTPWTGAFQALLKAGFVDSREGVGNCPSWPSWLGPVGLPIDHVLSRGGCEVFQREVIGRSFGSDHLPVRFRVRPTQVHY